MPTQSKIFRSPLEKSLKTSSSPNNFRYSKNVSELQEKTVQGVLFPSNSKKIEKISFTIDPSKKYIGFRENIHLEIHGKILLKCIATKVKPSADDVAENVTLHLNEKLMSIYLNNGINKFISNVKCTFNNSSNLNCSTLSFQDMNAFELYNDLEISLLKSSDEFKLTNFLQNDIISQFELNKLEELAGESEENLKDVKSSRIFRTTLPIFPFRTFPKFYKNRIDASGTETANISTPYDRSAVIPPNQRILVELDMCHSDNMLQKMWLHNMPLNHRFATEYNAKDKTDIADNLKFTHEKETKYEIQSLELVIDDAFLHYIDYHLNEPIPKNISQDFLGHNIVLSQLSQSSRQNINLFFPVDNNCTDLVITFIRESDLNSKMGDKIYSNCRSLPPGIKEMSITETNNLNSKSNIYQNFHLKNLHINHLDLSWRNYINYLIDNEYLDTVSANKFFSTQYSRIDRENSIDKTGHSAAMFFPITISNSLHQDQPLISIQTAQVNFSPLTLNLIFDKAAENLSSYYCCCVYFNRYNIDFNMTQNAISVTPVLCK